MTNHITKAGKAYTNSYRAWYQFLNMPFGAKQEETYANNYLLIRQEPRGTWTRFRAAEDVFKFRKIKGEN